MRDDRGVTSSYFGFSAVDFKARLSPGKRLQLKDRLPYCRPQPHPTTRGCHCSYRYTPHKMITDSTSFYREKRSVSPCVSISSRMQIFQGHSTRVKPTLTRPQSSKAECVILRHRRHAAIRCTAELTVFFSYTCTAAQ